MTVAEAIRETHLLIRDVAGEESVSQAKELVGSVIGVEPGGLMLLHQMELTDGQIVELGSLAQRRAGGEPLQYILGQWDFMGFPFIVNPHVLIPRPDTEVLCEAALECIRKHGYKSVLDLGCGTGCIGISIQKMSHAAVTLSDVSPEALEVARANAALLEAEVTILEGDLFQSTEGVFDVIVSNPPYLDGKDMAALQREVSFEPAGALFGGADGLDFYRRIAGEFRAHLSDGGTLLLEIGATQEPAILELFPGAIIRKDYGGNPRVAIIEK